MVLGIERILAGRTAGPRTYGLVAMGSCLITIIALSAVATQPGLMGTDAFPLLASIVTGVGFIGAGLIVFKDSKLSGLTTAAGIWVAAGIGMAVGFQLYLLAFFITFLTLFVFTIMWKIEHSMKSYFDKHGALHED